MFRRTLAAVSMLVAVVAASPSSANTVLIAFDGSLGTIRGNVTDCAGCALPITFNGFTGPGVQSPTNATGFDIGNASEAQEAAFLNTLAGTSFTTGVKTDGSGGDLSFQISAEYFSVKFGQFTAFFHNLTGGILNLVYDQTGTAAGASHFTQFGVPIPLPGALLLMASVLLGAGGYSKWRKRRAALA